MSHLQRVSITNGVRPDERSEFVALRSLRAAGAMRPLAARMALLVTMGWKKTVMAEAMDVSRVTVNTWLSTHTAGADTYTPYVEGAADPDSYYADAVNAPVTNLLTQRAGEELGEVGFEHDKFVVPAGFQRPLEALWRVAYRSRGPEMSTDADVAAAGDALDVLISLLLRRGVTNVAIARSAGVTHRAVLDRMNRARQRGLVLKCDGVDCEAFYGETDVRSAALTDVYGDAWLSRDEVDIRYTVPVRVTSPRASKYWLQTLFDRRTGRPLVIDGADLDSYTESVFRIKAAGLPSSGDVGAFVVRSELELAAALGRMNEASEQSTRVAETFRDRLIYVPAQLLYTEHVEEYGKLPVAASQAVAQVPADLWARFYEPFDVVKQCFFDPDRVEEEYGPIAKHRADARTRREQQ